MIHLDKIGMSKLFCVPTKNRKAAFLRTASACYPATDLYDSLSTAFISYTLSLS
jgi:hypothetical protein